MGMKGLASTTGGLKDGRETAHSACPPPRQAPSYLSMVSGLTAVCSLRVPCCVTPSSQCQLDSSS